jgi:predicted GNAT family N-acyltransferase
MNTTLSIRLMQPGEETQVCELITQVFDELVAPDFSPEGVEEFLKYVQPDALRERSEANHFALVATLGKQIVGVIELRNHNHISLYFVDQAHLGMGIGKELWRRTLAICRRENPELPHISVNSSPYAVPIYEKLGFRQTKAEQVVHGIRFVPMAIELG